MLGHGRGILCTERGRIIVKPLDLMDRISQEIAPVLGKTPLLIALDGACATGKSTLASCLGEKFGWDVLSMDEFFLPASQRGELSELGSNIAVEDLLQKVILPHSQGKSAKYCPYHCASGEYAPEKVLEAEVLLVEGVYSLLPALREYYGYKIFLTASWDCRRERLLQRGSDLNQFQELWIPREERYFSQEGVAQLCDLILDTENPVT